LWSNGATTQSITVTASGTYAVTATNGQGSDADTIVVSILGIPSIFSTDTTLCGGTVSLSPGYSGQQLAWFNDAAGQNQVYSGATYTQTLNANTAYYLQGQSYSNQVSVGPANNSIGTTTNLSLARGLRFNALANFTLRTVNVYAVSSPTITVQLLSANGASVLQQKTFTLTAGLNTLNLNFTVPTGNGYLLWLSSITGGQLTSNNNLSGIYPQTTAGIASITNGASGTTTNNNAFYYYFYNWQVSTAACLSAIQPFQVTALSSPIVNLPNDTTLCASSIVFDASNPSSSYSWSTGETSSSITATSSGNYGYTVTANNCSTTGSVQLELREVPSMSLPNDTLSCGGLFQINASHDGDAFIWSSPLGSAIAAGNTLSGIYNDTTRVFGQSFNYFDTFTAGALDTSLTTTVPAISTTARGLRFNANSAFTLSTVDIYSSSALTMNIELRNASNVVIQSRAISVPAAGKHTVALGFNVPQGTGLSLQGTGITGGTLLTNNNLSGVYPLISSNNIVSITSGAQGSSNNSGSYFYFYNWQNALAFCSSQVDSMNINLIQTPSINLISDTLHCGTSLSIDVSSPIANAYAWSSGQTTGQVTLNTSGIYYVTASNGPCAITDSIDVTLSAVPTLAAIVDTTICAGPLFLQGIHGGDGLFWFNAANPGSFVYASDSITAYISDSTQWYTESRLYFNNITAAAADNTISTNVSFTPVEDSGLRFTATQAFTLKGVKVYAQGNTTFKVDLRNSAGVALASKTLSVADGESDIDLYFDVPVATNLTLVVDTFFSGALSRNLSLSGFYPIGLSGVFSINAGIVNAGANSTQYNYFYNWTIAGNYCASPRDTFQVNVVQYPALELGQDSSFCDVAIYTLDAQNTGASYQWSTGATSQSIQVNTADTYNVTVTNANLCTRVDSVLLQFYNRPSIQIPQDTTLCQAQVFSFAQPDPSLVYLWYDSINATMPFASAGLYETFQANTQTYYLEAAPRTVGIGGQRNHSNPAGTGFSTFSIGTIFDVTEPITLDSVAVYVNAPATFELRLRNSAGVLLHSRQVSVSTPNQKVFVPAGFDIGIGTAYRLSFGNLSGGGLATDATAYPLQSNRLNITGSTVGGNINYYFFDWHYSYGFDACTSTREALTVTVRHPLNLLDSVYTCDPITLDATSSNATYAWSIGSSSPSIQVTESGTYSVTVSSTNDACVATDTIRVAFPAAFALPADGVLCGSTLSALYSPGSVYLWSTGATQPTISVTGPGTYAVTVAEPNGCILEDSMVVGTVSPLPTVNLPATTAACQQATLTAPGGFSQYLWSTGSTQQSINTTSPGVYGLTVTNSLGCSNSASTTLSIDSPPVANFNFSVSGNGMRYTMENLSTGGSYLWDFGIGVNSTFANPVVVFPSPGSYTIQLIVSNSCGSDTISQTVTATYTGLESSLALDQIILSPNPGHRKVKLSQLQQMPEQVDVFSANGQLMQLSPELDFSQRSIGFDVSDLPAGMYHVRLLFNEGQVIVVKRFVKE
jgi:hypothetical protein